MPEMTAVSLFDGIGGFPKALAEAGIRTVAAVEKDPAAAGVVADRYPEITHFDDVTEVTPDDLRAAGFVPGNGIITAGWPCQDLSLAGLRAGLGGARSGLFWEIIRLAQCLRPRWLLLENVPGLLSAVCPGRSEDTRGDRVGQWTLLGGDPSDGQDGLTRGRGACPGGCMDAHGGAMGLVLGALVGLGYGVAYRVLDAQHFGVPQRRRRVVIVCHLGDRAAPAEVLLEPEGGLGDPPPGGEAGPGPAADAPVSTLQGGGRRGHRVDAESAAGGHLIPLFDPSRDTVGTMTTGLQARPGGIQEMELLVGVDTYNGSVGPEAITMRGSRPDHLPHVLGFDTAMVPSPDPDADRPDAEQWPSGGPDTVDPYSGALTATAVRRLTPTECERLQGYPDGWTATSHGKPQADSARYRQLGNSIAVPVFAWVARRIAAYEVLHGPHTPVGDLPRDRDEYEEG